MTSTNELMARVAKALNGSFSPSGDEGVAETAETQTQNEACLEELYRDCCTEYGVENAISIEIFLRLFDVLIGLYRLDRCDELLRDILPAIDRLEAKAVVGTPSSTLTSRYKLKGIQCLAFTRWKQGRLSEAMELFIQMEKMMSEPSPALLENMGHTYSSMGNLDKAKEYFEKAMEADSPNRGGILLGLGLVSERSGDIESGLEKCIEALAWYEARFSKRENESSLEAKCCMSIAKLYNKRKIFDEATKYASRAVDNFRRTCGDDSPLLASALKALGENLARNPEYAEKARVTLMEAFQIEATKDAIDMITMMELIHSLTNLCQRVSDIESRERRFKEVLQIGETACLSVSSRLTKDGNYAAFLKFVAELAIYANELTKAKKLLEEAKPLFEKEKSVDCSGLVGQCTEIIALIDRRLTGQ